MVSTDWYWNSKATKEKDDITWKQGHTITLWTQLQEEEEIRIPFGVLLFVEEIENSN